MHRLSVAFPNLRQEGVLPTRELRDGFGNRRRVFNVKCKSDQPDYALAYSSGWTHVTARQKKSSVLFADRPRGSRAMLDRVMLLEHAQRCPSPWAKQDWQRRQEQNLAYVAITRAQQELIYVQ
jgi:hypothetical protein